MILFIKKVTQGSHLILELHLILAKKLRSNITLELKDPPIYEHKCQELGSILAR